MRKHVRFAGFTVLAVVLAVILLPANSYAEWRVGELDSAFSSVVPAVQTETVLVAKPLVYTVRRGDNLTHIAARFNVTLNQLLSVDTNPRLANRKNPDLLFRGERIVIPITYRMVEVPKKEVAPQEFVMTISSALEGERKESAAKLGNLNQELAMQALNVKFLVLVFGFALLVVLFLIVQLILKSKRTESFPENPTQLTLENKSAAEISDLMRTAKGYALDTMMKMAVSKNERGDAVLFRNIPDFLAKRTHLLDLPASQWEEAIKRAYVAEKSIKATGGNLE